MGETGILAPHDRVELIRGEILALTPVGPRHNAAVDRAVRAMVGSVGRRAIVRAGGSIRLDGLSEPEPDVALLLPREDFYASRHAGPADVLLILEVADSSLEYDRTAKARLYAEAGIPEYWVSDVENERLIVHLDPSQEWEKDKGEKGKGEKGKGYRTILERGRGEEIAPRLLPESALRIDDLLP
jgi:Uma2 family endonuclease